jgi:hypothetical protein
LRANLKSAKESIESKQRILGNLAARGNRLSDDAELLFENSRLLRQTLADTEQAIRQSLVIPHITFGNASTPRAYATVSAYLRAVDYEFDEQTFTKFVVGIQEVAPLDIAELWTLKPYLNVILLESVSDIADKLEADSTPPSSTQNRAAGENTVPVLATLITSLRRIDSADWKELFEQINATEHVLRQDPCGAYARMDFESREAYRSVIAALGKRSELNEQAIAKKTLELAGEPQQSGHQRTRERKSHVGYYLVGDGKRVLEGAIGYRPRFAERMQAFVKRWPDFSYILAIETVTLALITLVVFHAGLRSFSGFLVVALFFFPAAECAVALVNQLATTLFPAKALPKFDFSKGIPPEYTTMVAVPTLLTSEDQMKRAVRDLEIRFLANRDTNLHFALLTDPPDSAQQFDEKDKLAGRCAKLIEALNEKYATEGKGTFFLFHRHRAYNSSEEIWMGWERKRGKLLDFNKLLLRQGDSFPVKSGNLALLPAVKYVITLDLDTQLPRDAARRLVGTMAHPLHRAVIDPVTNTVVQGYGILQPRVDISIQSAGRSRLAAIFSGDAGFDIYTHAVSDVYQDLFGEGSFTGKGIYEVQTFQQVLEHRFPCNAILSHDMIEGAYARAGLASDIEVVDDYPTHISAFSRRKHRWVRGDWQVLFWILPRVPDFFGKMVRNPLTTISRWKIIDNVRRSLTEIGTFAMLLSAWLFFPGKALYWTIATLTLVVLPTYSQFAISILRAGRSLFTGAFWKNLGSDFAVSQANLFMRITCLCYQSLVMVDAVLRAIVRMTVTHERLLEWETSADAEISTSKKSPVETYLELTPWLSFFVGLFLAVDRPGSFMVALPLLVLWGLSKPICEWLNLPPRSGETTMEAAEKTLLRHVALRTWRMFREYSTVEENWLIPDTVQDPASLIVHRISTTNLGMLLNARIAAVDLGFYTWPELVADTEGTLDSVERMPKLNGHLYNWYDTQTLDPVKPRFISSVDNGNLVCCLWTLKQACLEAVSVPIFRAEVWRGVQDFIETIEELLVAEGQGKAAITAVQELKQRISSLDGSATAWAEALPGLERDVVALSRRVPSSSEAAWWVHELAVRIAHIENLFFDFAPWVQTQFARFSQDPKIAEAIRSEKLTLESLPRLCEAIDQKLQHSINRNEASLEHIAAVQLLRSALARSSSMAANITSRLAAVAARANVIAKDMDFAFLYDSKKKLLTTGYNVEENRLAPSHYDLLASEARAAVFVAIAKGEIPQEGWFALDRRSTQYKDEHVLFSWTGTMFEYLMPMLWMKVYPNTILDHNTQAALRCQQKYAEEKSIPCWGISEASCSKLAPDGHYHYEAFGVPALAVSREMSRDIVVSPYSSFLSLPVEPQTAIQNISKMKEMGLLGMYGFYEAADFTSSRMRPGSDLEIVRCWLAHHQGMSLVAVANLLCNSSSQRRFHSEPMVAATERLLHEKAPIAVQSGVSNAVDDGIQEPSPTNARSTSEAANWGVAPKFNTAA